MKTIRKSTDHGQEMIWNILAAAHFAVLINDQFSTRDFRIVFSFVHQVHGQCIVVMDVGVPTWIHDPLRKSITRAYEQYYTHEIKAPKWSANPLKLTKRAVRNGYLNRKWGASLSPSLNIFGMLLPKYFQKIIDEGVMRNLPRPANGGRLLDAGCGNGQFLSLAQNAGWRITGFDLDPKAVETARSRCSDVRLGGFETVQQERDLYDAITVSNVIEHVYQPKELLTNCYRLLKAGGYFWIITPNVGSYGHSEFKSDWRGLEPPRHLQLLSWNLLQRLLEEAGFKKVTRAFWQPEYLSSYISE